MQLDKLLTDNAALAHEFEDMAVLGGHCPPPGGDPDRTLQAVLAVWRLCGPTRVSFWGNVTEPAIFAPFGERADELSHTFLQRLLGLRPQDSTLVVGDSEEADRLRHQLLRLQTNLSTRRGGLGIPSNGGKAPYISYVASFTESLPRMTRLMGDFITAPPVVDDAPRLLRPAVTRAAREASTQVQNGRPEILPALGILTESLATGLYPQSREVQDNLNDDNDQSNLTSLLALGCPSAWVRFQLLSMGCPFASAWLNLIPLFHNGTTMSNVELVAAVRNRLLLHPLPAPADGSDRTDDLCAWCLDKPHPANNVFDHAHATLCPGPSYNSEHHAINRAIHGTVDALARRLGGGILRSEREVLLSEMRCVERVSDQERIQRAAGRSLAHRQRISRIDIYVRHQPEEDEANHRHDLYDVTLTSPPGAWATVSAEDPATKAKSLDHFIEEADAEKFLRFDTSYRSAHDCVTTFYPLAFDRSSGRPGASTLRSLKTIRRVLNTYISTASKFSVEQALTDRISVAHQAGIGRRIVEARRLHNWHARRRAQLAADAAAAAAVQHEGGAGGLP